MPATKTTRRSTHARNASAPRWGPSRASAMDPSKPLFVDKLRVFDSYLDPEKDPIGDVDVELT